MSTSGSFFSFTATRPVAITMVVAAAVVFGFVGLARLPVNLLPDITYPTVTIRTQYPGASPQDVEERVSERIQEAVSVISGVRRVISVSRPGVSDVILEFAWGTQVMFAVSDIRERLDRVFLPKESQRPLVLRYDPSLDPVMTLGMVNKRNDPRMTELRLLAEEEVERDLAKVDGVAAVKIRGGDEEEIRISVDEKALGYYGIDVTSISQRLMAENINAASGTIEERKTEYMVRALGEFRSVEDIEKMVVARRGDVSIRLSEVARVERIPADKEVISRIDGKLCVLIDIYREADANIVELAKKVRERAFGSDEQRAFVAAGRHLTRPPPLGGEGFRNLSGSEREDARREARDIASHRRQMMDYLQFTFQPLGVELDLLEDQSRFISNSIDDVLSAAIKGGFFAILIIYLFLRRFAATAILAVSIPFSLIATFAPMFMSDIDLNIMSLGGLALGVGMLVDNSIVVLESIHRAREEGHPRAEAGVLGVSRVAGAVIASTLTTIAVFFPIVFIEGVAGQLFRDQALTVVYALLMSLLIALFVIPMLATRGKGSGATAEKLQIEACPRAAAGLGGTLAWPLLFLGWLLKFLCTTAVVWTLRAILFSGGGSGWLLRLCLRPVLFVFEICYRAAATIYPGTLAAALHRRTLVVLIASGLLALSLWRLPELGNEMLPEVHQGEIYLDAFLPRDATVERTDQSLRAIEKKIATLADVDSTFLASGVDKEELNDSDRGEHSARILIRMKPSDAKVAQERRVRTDVREIVRAHPEIKTHRFARPSILSFTAPLIVEVYGRDLFALRKVCAQIEESLLGVPGLRDVRSTLQRGNPEISIKLDRDKVAALDLETRSITDILRTKVQGDVPTRLTERERKIDIRVRSDRRELGTIGALEQVNINPRGLPAIPLASVATIRKLEGPSEIRRLGNLRGAEIQAAYSGFDLGTIQDRVGAKLNELRLPRGITARIGGQKEDMEQSLRSLTMALLLAVFLVYIVMASQFESLVQPLVILVSLPLAMVGAILTLDLLGIPLSVIVFLGAIVLAGIVVNNAIILIDQINRLRAQGAAKHDAILRGAQIRLRPVLMTTLTTVLGLLPLTGWLGSLPLLGGTGEGLELRAPMAITVIAGLITSTMLTLVVVPVVYSLSDRKS